MEEIFRHYKVYIVIIIIISFLFISLLVVNSIKKGDPNKEFKHADYVKTVDEVLEDNIKSELPYINLKSKEIEKLNGEIASLFYQTIEGNGQFNYEYFINDNTLSLLIKIDIDSSDENVIRNYISYNVDYKNLTIIDNNTLLSNYGITMLDVSEIIQRRINYFYQYEIENGNINGNVCDFNCYTKMRNISFPVNDAAIVLENNQLYAYKPFNIEILLNGSEPYYEDDFKYKLN